MKLHLLSVRVCVCPHACVCVCARVCMCVCVSAHMWKWKSLINMPPRQRAHMLTLGSVVFGAAHMINIKYIFIESKRHESHLLLESLK